MTDRHTVRATPDFFAALDRQLSAERGYGDSPSRSDFAAYDLLPIVEAFAAGWDTLPALITGRPDYRILIAAGHLVHAVTVIGQLAGDGAVELVDIDVEVTPPWGEDLDDPETDE